MSIKKWDFKKFDKEKVKYISEKYNISTFLSMLFEINGLSDSEIESVLKPNYEKLLEVDYQDMKKAVNRIHKAIDDFEKICICGDYDADGVTATSLLYSYLRDCGANVVYKIPDRHKDGYGLNKSIIDSLKEEKVNLIITVDNGITAVEEIDYAKSFGIDTIITDHHKLPDILPNAYAIIDLYRENEVFKDFAGVGVVFKLIIALEGENADIDILLENYSDLVLIGTVGDVVPLKGENRLLVKSGLYNIKNTDKPGIRAILKNSGADKRELTATNIAFTIVPRINAAGRLSTTEKVVKLFTSDYEEEALEIARSLEEENLKRKEIEKGILFQVEEILKNDRDKLYEPILIINGKDWHPGVIGIVASKIVDKYLKPTIILTEKEGVARGSARSIEGFSIYDAIKVCNDYLIKFGGHPMAAGFDVLAKDIEKLKADILKFAKKNEVPFSNLKISCKLNPATLSVDLLDQINVLEPFGKDNEQPIFGLYGMKLLEIIPVGDGNHLRLIFSRDDKKFTVIKFFTKKEDFFYVPGDIVDLAVLLSKSYYNGQESLSLYLEDIKFSDIDNEYILNQKRIYENFKIENKEASFNEDDFLPNREDFSSLYRCLKGREKIRYDINILYYRLIKRGLKNISFSKFLIMLDIFKELKLIEIVVDSFIYEISLNEITTKVDLNSSEILRKIKLWSEKNE